MSWRSAMPPDTPEIIGSVLLLWSLLVDAMLTLPTGSVPDSGPEGYTAQRLFPDCRVGWWGAASIRSVVALAPSPSHECFGLTRSLIVRIAT